MSASYVDSHQAPGKGEQYDRSYASDRWQTHLWKQEQRVLRRIVAECTARGPVDLLDFACGTGRITGAIEDQVRTSTGVDVSESMLALARAKLTRSTLVRANILEESVFDGRTFDLITAFRFFVNAEPALRRDVMRELASLLAPGGRLVFNDHQNSGSLYIQLTRGYAAMRGFKFANTLSIAECRALLAEHGLEIERIHPVAMLHLPRVHFPTALYRGLDRVAEIVPGLARFAECPIIVARHRAR